MSTATISTADNLFVGNGYDPMLSNLLGRPGVPFTPKRLVSLGTPALADADYLVAAATSTELPNNATITYTWATDGTSPLDNADTAAPTTITLPSGSTALVVAVDATYGRNLVCAKSAGTVAMTVVISGYDYLKRAMTESFTLGTGTTASATGTKAFKYIESIAISSAGNATANTLNIGTGSVLGLPERIEKIGHVTFASIGGVQELIGVASNATVVAAVTTAASATTGDVRGTIAFTTALDGSKEAIVEYYVSGRNSGPGLVGVAQA